jgi:hypothetical protein
VVALLLVLGLGGCKAGSRPSTKQSALKETTPTAVYLTPEAGGHLSVKDLAAHPEVTVVHERAAFERAASTRTALWIDLDSSATVDWAWVGRRGRDFYPVALIGQRRVGTLSDKLGLSEMYYGSVPLLGFSIWIVNPKVRDFRPGYILRGYVGSPTVERISAVTGPAVQGRYPWLTPRVFAWPANLAGRGGSAQHRETETALALSSASGHVGGWDVVVTVAASMQATQKTSAKVSAVNSSETTLSSAPLMHVEIRDSTGKQVESGSWSKYTSVPTNVAPGSTFAYRPEFTVPPPGDYTIAVPGMKDPRNHPVAAPFTSTP